MANNGPIAAFCFTCTIVFIVTVILVGVGFSRLEVNEVGIDYSANSLTINTNELYTNGIHFLGVGHSFIKFPKRQVTLTMQGGNAIIARTNDGLIVTLHTKLLYRLDANMNSLASLYLMFKEDYQVPIENICRSVIRDVASTFSAYEFWSKRGIITKAMQDALDSRLKDVFVIVETFLLSSFILPKAFQNVIDVTEVAKQEKNKVEFEIERVDQETQAQIIKAQQTVKQITITTVGLLREIELAAEAKIYQLEVSITQEIQGYKLIKNELNMTNDELTTMIWLDKMRQSKTPKTIAVKTPTNILM